MKSITTKRIVNKLVIILLILSVVLSSTLITVVIADSASAEIISGGVSGLGTENMPYIETPWNGSMKIITDDYRGSVYAKIDVDVRNRKLSKEVDDVIIEFAGITYSSFGNEIITRIAKMEIEVTFYSETSASWTRTAVYERCGEVKVELDSHAKDIYRVKLKFTVNDDPDSIYFDFKN